jgi:hypothetical protein
VAGYLGATAPGLLCGTPTDYHQEPYHPAGTPYTRQTGVSMRYLRPPAGKRPITRRGALARPGPS